MKRYVPKTRAIMSNKERISLSYTKPSILNITELFFMIVDLLISYQKQDPIGSYSEINMCFMFSLSISRNYNIYGYGGHDFGQLFLATSKGHQGIERA